MLRLTAVALMLMPAVFLASPLTADDVYGAPDPGWYNAGSGWARDDTPAPSYEPPTYGPSYGGSYDSGLGYQSDGYDGFRSRPGDSPYGFRSPEPEATWAPYAPPAPGYEPYEDDMSGADRYGVDRFGDRAEPWQRRDAPEPVAPNGFGAPDWAQQPLPPSSDGIDRQWRSGFADDPVLGGDAYRDGGGQWRTPAARPRFRFREDPSLEQPAVGGTGSRYHFRPLTPTEQERHRGASTEYRFAEPRREQRYRPQDRDQQGTAFGYAPGPPPQDDFYQRYYRGVDPR